MSCEEWQRKRGGWEESKGWPLNGSSRCNPHAIESSFLQPSSEHPAPGETGKVHLAGYAIIETQLEPVVLTGCCLNNLHDGRNLPGTSPAVEGAFFGQRRR